MRIFSAVSPCRSVSQKSRLLFTDGIVIPRFVISTWSLCSTGATGPRGIGDISCARSGGEFAAAATALETLFSFAIREAVSHFFTKRFIPSKPTGYMGDSTEI